MQIDSQVIAGWAQAAAALIQAGVAIALFAITKRYVDLTSRLAASSEAQVELMRAEREFARAEKSETKRDAAVRFRQLATNLLDRVRQLPGPGPEARQAADRLFRSAILPTDDQVDELARLATALGPSISSLANAATENMHWLLRLARTIQATSEERGFHYDRMNWNEWVFRWIEAESALSKLALDA